MWFFLTPEFWVAVSFFVFLWIIWKVGGWTLILEGLDSRGKRIRAELDEARRLREEAQRAADEANQRMTEFVRRRTAAAEAKIAQAEAQAAAQVRAAAAEAAIRVSEAILREKISGQVAEDLVTRSLGEVRAKMH